MKINKLETLLDEEVKECECSNKKRNLFSQVYITKGALKKAYTYAKLACDVFGQSVECYGYLITPKDKKDRVVRDVYLAKQEVSAAYVSITGEDVINAGKEIDKMGYKVLGWWHSHANFSTFHSSTDDANMKRVLNAIAPTNQATYYKKIPLGEGELKAKKKGKSIVLSDQTNPKKKIYLDMPEEDMLNPKDFNLEDVRIEIPVKVGFAYSIVVNACGDPAYSEIATKEFCGTCYNGEEKSRRKRLRLIEEKLEIDKDILKKEVEEKLYKRQTPFFRKFPNPFKFRQSAGTQVKKIKIIDKRKLKDELPQ